MIAYPWRHRERAQALGHAVAGVLDALPAADLDAVLAAASEHVQRSGLGDAPIARRPHVPVVAITGTNGKTTTSRMVARMGRCAGLVVGWSSTDGVYVDGELVEAGRLLRAQRSRPGARTTRASSSPSPRPRAAASCSAASASPTTTCRS